MNKIINWAVEIFLPLFGIKIKIRRNTTQKQNDFPRM